MSELTDRLRKMASNYAVQGPRDALEHEAADALNAQDRRIEELEAERDELHEDVLTTLRVRNAALTQAAAHFHPGPDGADDRIRQALIEEWVIDGHEQVAEENRQRTQMLSRMVEAERERDAALARVAELEAALRLAAADTWAWNDIEAGIESYIDAARAALTSTDRDDT